MGWRVRQRIKIFPGMFINLGKKGINSVSLTAGWFTTNFNKKGVKHTTGLHGTGLSYETEREPYPKSSKIFKKVFWWTVLGVLLFMYVASI